jgi:hypothetical protein
MSGGARRALKALAWAALATAVIALAINSVSPHQSEPPGSSYATSGGGLSAYAELLTRSGHRVVRLRAAPSRARLDPAGTVIVLDPAILAPADVSALARFVDAGGVLLAGGQDPGPWLARLMPDPPAWQPGGQNEYVPLLATAETAGVSEVLSAGQGSWSSPRAALPVLGTPDASLVDVAVLGAGRIELLADSSTLENQLLANADDAALGLALAGPAGRPVAFDEGVHGYGSATGLAALPSRWKWALLGLLLAALTGVGARFRRLAAPDPEGVPALPPRRAHVDAIALALARSGPPGRAAASVREHALRQLRTRAGLDPGAGATEVAEAASRLGLDEHETDALTSDVLADDGLLAAGRGLAKLSGPRA